MGDIDLDKAIFKGVFFAIIPNADINEETKLQLEEILVQNGATRCILGSNELNRVTHLIASTADFPAYHDAVDAFIHVVKPSWVYQSRDKQRTANPRQHSPDPRLFLSDIVVACADDIPEGDKDAIIGGVQAMGGQYTGVMNKLVTHVVALTMDNKQCKLIVDKGLSCKPVLPHWFDACLMLGKQIDATPYVLPDPAILAKQETRPSQVVNSTSLQGAARYAESFKFQNKTGSFRASISKERREVNIFKNKLVMLHSDLGLSDRLEDTLFDLINTGGGAVSSDVNEADMLVCRYRESPEFEAASMLGKDVGNLNWLYYMINYNTWTSPFRRLLHYPYPVGGIPGFKGFKITISNYAGEARIYLESLVKAAGGDFTKTMSQENTHLITAHAFSEKCDAAKEWNINTVNHLWLEESYAYYQIQAITNPRYTTFPKNTNLAEVVGQTEISREAIAEHFLAPRREKLEPIELNGENSRTPIRRSNVDRTSSSATPAATSGASAQRALSGRGAKSRALNKLHSMAPDIALFEKESKRVGGVIYGGRRANDEDRVAHNSKRSLTSHETVETAEIAKDPDDIFEVSSPASKKQKKAGAQHQPFEGPRLKILITGLDAKQDIRAKTRAVKVSITNDPTSDFDVLVAPRVLKTPKFLCGLAKAPTIVNETWLDRIITNGTREPPDRYILKHQESERDLDVSLSRSLKLAKQNVARGGMLKGWTIFCTQNAHGGFEAYERIIRANGGQCMLWKGRETHVLNRPRSSDSSGENENINNAHDDNDVDMVDSNVPKSRLYLISCEDDKPLWGKFRYMCESQGFQPMICKPDWIIRIALTQDLSEWQQWWIWEGQ